MLTRKILYSVNPSIKLQPRSQSNGIYSISSVMQLASCRFRLIVPHSDFHSQNLSLMYGKEVAY